MHPANRVGRRTQSLGLPGGHRLEGRVTLAEWNFETLQTLQDVQWHSIEIMGELAQRLVARGTYALDDAFYALGNVWLIFSTARDDPPQRRGAQVPKPTGNREHPGGKRRAHGDSLSILVTRMPVAPMRRRSLIKR